MDKFFLRLPLVFAALFCTPLAGVAQSTTDTGSLLLRNAQMLDGTVVRAFGARARRQDIPAAVSIVDRAVMGRFSESSVVNAVNTVPGVRLEERTPGSLRLAVRGSALRSPFGVRNVKIYYNDIPLTDPGGLTYLNALGYYNIARMEIAKGPAGSAYGAGTGGVALIESIDSAKQHAGAEIRTSAGSYGLSQTLAAVSTGTPENGGLTARYQRRSYDGYRAQSRLEHHIGSLDAGFNPAPGTFISAHFLYSDLYYETPGALTLAEYKASPRDARPGTAASPGAVQNRAAIYQENALAGIRLRQRLGNSLSNTTTIYTAYSRLRNPTIRNYSRASEAHAGGRTAFTLERNIRSLALQWTVGGEFQSGISAVRTYDNRNGTADTLRSDDESITQTGFAFTQLSLAMGRWTLLAGGSYNRSRADISRLSKLPLQAYRRPFENGIAPRISLLFRQSARLSIYAIASGGFSPPTLSELSPTGGEVNAALTPERGANYELGFRGRAGNDRFSYDLNLFHFALQNTIVLRRDAQGGDYYLNAGNTIQNGAEAALTYRLVESIIWPVEVWAAYTYYHFRYGSFVQATTDFSGNDLPGVPPHSLAAGIDAAVDRAFYAHLTYYYNAAVPLNDAGTAALKEYHLLGLRLSYRREARRKSWQYEIYAGADNLLDATYSLGPDINGFGGRYYNASPGRSFYAGIAFGWKHTAGHQ